MPLTLELYGTNSKQTGRLIIDRNNLIIAYPADSSMKSINKAFKNRDGASKLIHNSYAYSNNGKICELYPLSSKQNFANAGDPRHDALEHMSGYDRYECKHAHWIFKDDIDFNLIHLIFSNLHIDNRPDLISNDCINNILAISKNYFSELKTSDTAKRIEAEYRELKEREFKKATLIVEKQKKKESSLDHQSSFETNKIEIEEVELKTAPTAEQIEFKERLKNIRSLLFSFDASSSDSHTSSSSSSDSNCDSGSDTSYNYSEYDFNMSYPGMRRK